VLNIWIFIEFYTTHCSSSLKSRRPAACNTKPSLYRSSDVRTVAPADRGV